MLKYIEVIYKGVDVMFYYGCVELYVAIKKLRYRLFETSPQIEFENLERKKYKKREMYD